MQDCASSNKIKENKYKILRMSLLLGSDDDRGETLNNFEDASRDIDAMNDEVYLKEIESKFYDTLKLEEEEKKLTALVDYIGGRVEQRISLLSDFANVTGYDLQGLPPIKYYDKLDDYKDRLKYIREYLSNIEKINKLDLEIENADTKLNEAYITKATAEEQNLKNEESLQKKFNNLIKNVEIFKDVTEDNIEQILGEVTLKVQDSKKSLDIFTKSFTTLSGSGISLEEEQEYLSYVEGAEKVYYDNKEEEYLLKIYNLLREKYSDYTKILLKREELNNILYERINLRKDLKIATPDVLSNLYDVLEKQYEDIKRQNFNIEKIEKLTAEINLNKDKLNDLVTENQKVEILSLLREFCIIDTYEEPNEEIDVTEEIVDIPNEGVETADEINLESVENNIDLEIPSVDVEEPLSEEKEIVKEDVVKTENFEMKDDFFMPELPEAKITVPAEEVKEEPQKTEEIKVEDEESKENQVIAVEDAKSIDLDLINSKASKVMKRVGDMLGIKTEETKIVTVSNEPTEKEEVKAVEQPKEIEEPKKEEAIPEQQPELPNFFEEEVKEEPKTEVEEMPPFAFAEVPVLEEAKPNPSEQSVATENPLFGDNLENTINFSIDPEFRNAISAAGSGVVDPEESNNDFWFPSDTPDALNELPDLDLSNNDNFFMNNNVSDLQFPDLNIDFGNNNTEGK